MFLVDLLLTHKKNSYYNYNLVNDMEDPVLYQIDEIQVGSAFYDLVDSTVPSWAKQSTKPTYNGGEVKYTGTSGNVVTNNTTLNVAIKAIDDAIGNVETLLARI